MSARLILPALAGAILLTSGAGTALAQAREDWRATEEDAEKPPLVIQQNYHGVTPGAGNNLPRVEELRGKAGTWVTWPGFFLRPDGGSRIFLQTTVQVQYQIEQKKKRIVIKLQDAEIFLSNNQNPLVTTHFNTPVKRTFLKKKRKKPAELVIELKVDISPVASQTVDRDGYHYMFIDFPPGTYPRERAPSIRPAFTGPASTSKTIAAAEPTE